MDSKKQNLAKILLVEDSRNEFLLTQMLLRRENVVLDMDLARTPNEAIKYLKSNQPDLIVIDKRLAELKKNKIIREIQKIKKLKNTPVIMLFGIKKETSTLTPYSCEMGANLCLDKPLNHDKLSFIIKQVGFLSFQAAENKIYLCSKRG